MKKSLLFILCSVIIYIGNAQEDNNDVVDNIFLGTRLVNGQSANLAEKGKLHFLIQHRFGDISGGLYQLFGLDQAAMRLGFEYGLGNNVNIGFGRSSYQKTYDVYGKFRAAQQSNNFPVTVTFTATGSAPTIRDVFPPDRDFGDKLSTNLQMHLAKTVSFIGIQISPGYHSSGYISNNFNLTVPSEDNSFSMFTLGLAGSVKISKKVAANLEYLAHFNSDIPGDKPLSLGVDIETRGHIFQLVLSNTQRMFTNGLYTNTAGSWQDVNLFFGFNLIREFTIKYY